MARSRVDRIRDEHWEGVLEAARNDKFGYEYPQDLDLRPGSELHELIVKRVNDYVLDSLNYMNRRYDGWEKIDEANTAYMPLSEKEEQDRLIEGYHKKKPFSMVIPMSYAIRETILTYLVSTFFQDTVFQFEGHGPEDEFGAILLEKVISHQVRRFNTTLRMYCMWNDAIKYGIGALSPVWVEEVGVKYKRHFLNRWGLLDNVPVFGGLEPFEARIYAGPTGVNINPYSLLLDPNTSALDVQSGECVGWRVSDNLMSLLGRDTLDGTDLVNVKYLQIMKNRRSAVMHEALMKQRGNDPRREESYKLTATDATNPVDVVYMYLNIIPAEWGLSEVDRPEKWLFCVAADSVVLLAQPMGYDHGEFPIALATPELDAYSIVPIGTQEISYPMQEALDFMINSFIAYMRRGYYGQWVYNPDLINGEDLKRPEHGRYVRLKRNLFGGKVTDAITQFPIDGQFGNNIQYAGAMLDFMQRTHGASDIIQGFMRHSSERRTATEARGAMLSASARMEKMARLISLQAHMPIARQFASLNQQLLDDDIYVKVTGRWEQVLRERHSGRIEAGDRLLANRYEFGDAVYDVVPHDGTLPRTEYADLWAQVLQIVSSNPILASRLDVSAIGMHLFRMMGAKNIDDFSVKTQVMPDEQVAQQAQAGNLIPIGGENGGNGNQLSGYAGQPGVGDVQGTRRGLF